MSNYRFNEWSKRTERFDNDTANSSLWNDFPEEDEKEIKKIKQQWQKQQRKEFKRIKQHDFQRKNTKAVVSTLITLAIVGVGVSFVPNLLKMTKQTLVESFSTESEVVNGNQNGSSDKSPSIIEKLKALEKRSKTGNFKDDCVKTPTAVVCQSEENNVTGNGAGNIDPNQPSTINEQVHQSIDQINEYNKKLQEVMDGS